MMTALSWPRISGTICQVLIWCVRIKQVFSCDSTVCPIIQDQNMYTMHVVYYMYICSHLIKGDRKSL